MKVLSGCDFIALNLSSFILGKVIILAFAETRTLVSVQFFHTLTSVRVSALDINFFNGFGIRN